MTTDDLTTMDTEVLLQMMLVLEGFLTLCAFELAVASNFIHQLRLKENMVYTYCRNTILNPCETFLL